MTGQTVRGAPIIAVKGREVLVEGTLRHLSGDGTKLGTLRVTCPAAAGAGDQ